MQNKNVTDFYGNYNIKINDLTNPLKVILLDIQEGKEQWIMQWADQQHTSMHWEWAESTSRPIVLEAWSLQKEGEKR